MDAPLIAVVGYRPPVGRVSPLEHRRRLGEAVGVATLTCSCHHHQGIDRLGDGLIPVAWAGDGLIEGVERPEGWMVAVQSHPEETAAADPTQQTLFGAFAEQSRTRRARPA
jgi:putative glutamine amidotransferase